ncbi:MAG: GNAT family N-acetyltransferase [candidate division WOR-3 bacterium]|nr:MAG: GNAT family N-acetyltransferase [candidate division WOR-3 bacterium]
MDLTVRRARPGDRQRVLDICRKTWNGWDYVPLFFDRWVNEPGFWMGEYRGKVVGFGKATRLSGEEWWLEGLRVDPKYRSRGFGTRLSFRILRETLGARPAFLRLATADVNSESIRIIERMGFRPHFSTSYYVCESVSNEPGPTRGLSRPDARRAHEFLGRSEELAVSRGLMSWTWVFCNATRDHVRELCRMGAVYGYGRKRLQGLLIVRPHRYFPGDLYISHISGTRPALRAFRGLVLRTAAERGSESIRGAASSPAMKSAFAELGMELHPRIGRVLVYDFPI